MDFKHELGVDPEQLADDADRLFDRMRRLHSGTEATARAGSGNGWVSVEYGSSSGVQGLRLDPRAMRMDSAQLAETILDLIHQAKEQAEAEERERAEALLDSGLLTDRGLVTEQLRQATGTLRENLERASATIDRVRALLRP
ncbi:YbaB/EbfC family nucleoid-associated protein [Nonomuraea guangzhouensis]|uniref:YbaB/EbfC family nucleoid-associated protein n=1 Tax=Nonomuraea guangzhouensis TaxID=1291555 RepID=A0ABW4GHB8_9ACTN|nr:YbaB/EbfC family nucleoid-associated protein [Nonomuraea guangzhouensis]